MHICLLTTPSLLDEDLILPMGVAMIRFALGFLTVLCNADARGIILRENVSSFFSRLSTKVIVDFRKRAYPEKLLASMIVALTAAEKYFKCKSPLISDDDFWILGFSGRGSQFFTSCWWHRHLSLILASG
jgi:hypothetical protein